MKKLFSILSVLLSTFITFSCSENEDDKIGNKPNDIVVTSSAEVHSATSVTLTGYANEANEEIGFCYSATEKNPTPDNADKIKATSIMSDNSYSVTLTGLSAGTTYYYCAYVTIDGHKVMAKDVRSFKTFKAEAVLVTGISVKGSYTRIRVGQTLQLSVVVKPENASNKSVTWTSGTTSIATVSADGLVTAVSDGQVEIKAQANDGSGVVGKFELTVMQTGGNSETHEYVDLGLPSKLKWATMNVGATAPEDYGDYFAWGETEPKDNYDWSNYKWCNGGPMSMTKYCADSGSGTVDSKRVLDPEDDAAYINWGGTWRMPTSFEQWELIEKCTWTWTTQNGVNGYKVTGPNGNFIFLPAAGYRLEGDLLSAGSKGDYSSSELYTAMSSLAMDLDFDKHFKNRYGHNRCHGKTVRAVCK